MDQVMNNVMTLKALAISTLPTRVTESWATAQLDLAQRVKEGVQPDLPYTDFNTVLGMNIMYLTVIAILYIIMSNRKEGFKLKGFMIVYNAICVFLAGYCVVGIIKYKLKHPGSLNCNTLQFDADGKQLAWVYWVFYAQKYWEFIDTWIFLLRKSFRQVSFLHVFHHSSVTIIFATCIPYDFNGDLFLPILLNGTVHVLMYSHYLLTALGVKSWWRTYLTSLQLGQFCLIAYQNINAWIKGPQCGAPDFEKYMVTLYMGSMLFLFGNFFIHRYILAPTKPKKTKQN